MKTQVLEDFHWELPPPGPPSEAANGGTWKLVLAAWWPFKSGSQSSSGHRASELLPWGPLWGYTGCTITGVWREGESVKTQGAGRLGTWSSGSGGGGGGQWLPAWPAGGVPGPLWSPPLGKAVEEAVGVLEASLTKGSVKTEEHLMRVGPAPRSQHGGGLRPRRPG